VLSGPALLASVHGQVGVLAAAALAHPALSLRPGVAATVGQKRSLAAGAALYLVAMAAGFARYDGWRKAERTRLAHTDLSAVMFFERKEHLAFLGALLVVVACAAVWSAPGGHRHGTARLACAGAALAALYAAATGTIVGALR
jgi:cbb3-type cytochrome oxidase subunit 1